ncbi:MULTISPECIES: hypothetical protein [Bacillus cereus group]|uniref:hypothetical protein n=1 Tax=Bacillus cereus group TaxID=86661 RepID=UPI001301C733|nr:hypothetical protein [Bacillus thuringiensis]
MSNDRNKYFPVGDQKNIRNNSSEPLKGVGTVKVTRDKFNENTTTYLARNNNKKQGK